MCRNLACKKLTRASAPILLVACLASGCKITRQPDASTQPYNADYISAISKAADHAAADQVSAFVHNIAKLTLKGSHLTGFIHVAETTSSTLAVLDSGTKRAYLFDRTGSFIGPLGDRGREPGDYLSPIDIISTPSNVAILDFTNHRVTYYTDQGKFAGSFIYTAQEFSATKFLYNRAANTYTLFGNRWKPGLAKDQKTADLVHIFKGDGTFQTSSFEFPDKWLRLGLIVDDSPITAKDGDGAEFFTLPFDYTIYRISMDGTVTPILTGAPAAFRSPIQPLNLKDRNLARFHSWELQWTPIRALAVMGDYALVEYESFSGLRYTVDTWCLSKRQHVATYHTNYLIVNNPDNGRVILVDNPKSGGYGDYDVFAGILSL
jgi:hypothetical protein